MTDGSTPLVQCHEHQHEFRSARSILTQLFDQYERRSADITLPYNASNSKRREGQRAEFYHTTQITATRERVSGKHTVIQRMKQQQEFRATGITFIILFLSSFVYFYIMGGGSRAKQMNTKRNTNFCPLKKWI